MHFQSWSVVEGGWIRPRSPIDGKALTPIPVTPPEEVREVVRRAKLAQAGWAKRSLEERVRALRRGARAILERRDEVLALMREEVGKLEVDALMSEVIGPLDQLNAWARVVRQGMRREWVSLNPIAFPRKAAYIDRVPRGVVGIIAPWNYPVATLFRSVFPALLTGNAVVFKPSEYASQTERWVAERLAEGLPPDLLFVVMGGKETGIALIESGIDACVFTGSVASGREVAARCASRLIPCSVELGGKDAAIVLEDCDLERTIAGVTHWSLHNVGQACGAIEIAYVEERIADAFVEGLVGAWEKLRVGPMPPGDVDISPLSHAKQLKVVMEHVEDAVAKGARLVCGGRRVEREGSPMGCFYEPTILDHCRPGMRVVDEETFGPVLAVVRVSGAAQAIEFVNRGRYGLTASIWTRDIARAERLAEQLDVGVVTINNHALTGGIPALPWSGTKDTGPGVANGVASLHTFTRPRSVLIDRNRTPELYWMPYDRELWELGNLLADLQVGQRLHAAWKLPLMIRSRVKKLGEFYRSVTRRTK
ncbi:MAG: aldehyde dehydrogenase family protein [Sandaracinaceae bacterium]|nr:aldehyde dehydrogenase family protein [Sandaracinaceae bacterium]